MNSDIPTLNCLCCDCDTGITPSFPKQRAICSDCVLAGHTLAHEGDDDRYPEEFDAISHPSAAAREMEK